MKKILTLLSILALGLVGACGNHDATVKTLKAHGFTDISTQGWDWFACGDDDTWKTKFRATNPAGQRTSGTVCCGLIAKGCTIRF